MVNDKIQIVLIAGITILMTIVMVPLIGNSIAASEEDARSFEAQSDNFLTDTDTEFNDGTLNNVNVSGSGSAAVVIVDNTSLPANYTTAVKTYTADDNDDRGDLLALNTTAENVTATNLNFTIETSNDGFSTVAGTQTGTITANGTTETAITLADAESVRVRYDMATADLRLDSALVEAEIENETTPSSVSSAFSLGSLIPLLAAILIIAFVVVRAKKTFKG